jgi:hypothetical protein
LPATGVGQKLVVFELQPPASYIHWRDSLLFLTTEALKADHTIESRPRAYYPLARDSQLSRVSKGPSRRIILLSEDKPHSGTHRKALLVSTATETAVCPPSGFNYKYYDDDVCCFMSPGGFETTDKIPLERTYQLTRRSTALQKYIFRPVGRSNGEPPNAVIANLSESPEHMSLNEFKKLSSVPCGYSLQWPNILVRLAVPAIDFKNIDTTLVVLQCIYQAGPPNSGVTRAGHAFLDDEISAVKLLEELRLALERIKESWESPQALSVFISIASRLLSITSSSIVQDTCVTFLQDARAVALNWIVELREKT